MARSIKFSPHMWNVNYNYVVQKQFKLNNQTKYQPDIKKFNISNNTYIPIEHNDIGSTSALMIVAMLA